MKKLRKRFRTLKSSNQNSQSNFRRDEKFDAPPVNPGIQDVPRSLKEFLKLKELAEFPAKNDKEYKVMKEYNESNELRTKKNGLTNLSKITSLKDDPSRKNTNFIHSDDSSKVKSINMRKKRKLKLMKLKQKKKLKKEQKRKEVEDESQKEFVKEHIKFGEVVHRPPELLVRPRKVMKTGFENRPGRKDDLLLKSLLNQTESTHKHQLCQKRKYLSAADQRQLELERRKALLSYKNFK